MRRIGLPVLVVLVFVSGQSVQATERIKADNTEPLNAGASWVGGTAPTASDVAVWSNNLAGANSSALTNAATWDGVKVVNPGGPVTVSGAYTLTLDGGAATDINLTSATCDLTLSCPVSMDGTLTTDVATGRTLTFSGPLTTSSSLWGRTGTGTVIFDGVVTSAVNTTLELQRGTNVFTGKNGGLSFTSTGSSRIYVGRYSYDATLIISNGVHETRGMDDQASANFVGVGAQGHLLLEGGSLRVVYLRAAINGGNGEIVVNNGTLEATGGGGTGTKAYALMIGNNHTDASSTSSAGSGSLTVNGGQAIFTNGIVKLGSYNAASTGTQTLSLYGGTLAVRQIYADASILVPKNVTLDGGTLAAATSGDLFAGPALTNGTLKVYVGDAGATIDTGANDVTNAAALLFSGSGDGGLTKRGDGILTLSGTNTYTGQTVVEEGTLRLTGPAASLHPSLAVRGGGGFSLRDGQLATFSPATFTVSPDPAAAAALELELAASGTACDVLALPEGATLGRLNVVPFVQGTVRRAKAPGDYAIMTYTDGAPDISRLTVLDPAPLTTYTFLLDTGAKTVVLRITASADVSEWIAPTGGAWETASNWSAAPASAAGTRVVLGDYALTAPATVTLASPVTLGGLTFSSAYAFTLSGSGLTFDNGSEAPYLNADEGAHTVATPMTISGAFSVAPTSGASLVLAGAVSGSGSLVKAGAGDATLTHANTYAGGTSVQAGSLVLAEGATLGTGPVSFDGGSGLRFAGTSDMTLSNDVAIASSAYATTLSNDVELAGDIDWQGYSRVLLKAGSHELALSGSGSETAWSKFEVDSGTLRFKRRANFSLSSTSDRDSINMKLNNGLSRAVVLEDGAQLTVSGVDMENGADNTFTVDGGSLTLLGGGGSSDALVMKSQGAGIDRFIVNGGSVSNASGTWIGVGFRVGDAYLTINGGTTTLSRVSLGARDMDMDLSARGFVEINGGRLEVTDSFGWMGSSTAGRTNIVTLGNGTVGSGVWRTCATYNPRYDKSNTPILVFNGGTLELSGLAAYGSSSLTNYLYGAKVVNVDVGGARVDTRGLDATIAQPLLQGAVSDGGFTKLGAGSLTLAGECAFTGPTVVEQGSLTLPAVYGSTGLTLASDTQVSLVNGSIQTLDLGAATLPSGSTLVFEALPDASACDRIALPSGATVGDLSIALVQAGTAVPVSRPGDYVLFTCSGSVPSVEGWTLLNPPSCRICSFEAIGSTVVLHIAYAAGASVWTASGSGDWDVAGNWSSAPADAAGTAVRFDDAIAAPATVTRATATTVGAITFNNLQPYTLAGGAVTLTAAEGTQAVVAVESGVHTLTAALALSGDATVRASAGATLALNGAVGGAGTLTVEGPGALALPDASGLSIGGLTLVSGGMLVLSNSADFGQAITLGTGGGGVAPAYGQSVAITAAVDGSGGLTKDASSVLALTNANASYTGGTTVKAGTLLLDQIPDGGITFGPGTLHYAGAGATTAGGYTLDTGDDTLAGVLRTDDDVTFAGNVCALSGALVKTGPGTATFTAPGLNVFNAGNGAGISHDVLDIGVYGDSPTVGFSGFNVADGKVVIGAEGQTNVFNGLLVIGLNTTTNADAETAGELDVVGGSTVVSDTLIVGRSNGTTNTAPVARVSKLKMTAGTLSAGSLVLGRTLVAAGHNSAPEVELEGGTLSVASTVLVGEQSGAVGTVRLTGGTLAAPTLTRVNGQANLVFDGGTFRPNADAQTLQGLTSATVGAGGATFDLSLADTFTLTQVLTSDGGLTKTGAGKLIVNAKQGYAGPTLVSEGTLRIPVAGGLSNVTALTVSPGAALELDATGTQTVSVATLALGVAGSSPAAVTLAFAPDGSGNDRFVVSGSVSLGTVVFTFNRTGISGNFGLNGTYPIIAYTGDAPSVTELSVANPLYGKRYTFAADAGVVTVTVSTDYTGTNGGAVWNVTGGGNWSDSGNWVSAPGAGGTGQQVRFGDKLTAAATVSLGSDATVGSIYFENTNAYTVAGTATLTLDNGTGTQAVLSVESGTHAITAPVTVSGAGAVVQTPSGTALALDGAVSGDGALVKTASGNLIAGAASTRTGSTEIQGGELYLKNGGNVGSGELLLNGATGIRVTGSAPAALTNALTLTSGTTILRPEEQSLTLSGALSWLVGGVPVLYKWGSNDLIFATAVSVTNGTPKLYVRQGGVTFAKGSSFSLAGSSRESIKLGLNAGYKTALTVASHATVKIGGILVSADTATTAGNDASITVNGGALTLSNTSDLNGDALVLRDWGTAPASLVMNDGTFTMPQASWLDAGGYGPGRITVNGGTLTAGRFAAGYQMTNAISGGSTEVTVNGGRMEVAGSWSWMSDGGARPTDVRVNGGTLALPATRIYGTNANCWASLTLAGGNLETLGAALDSTATDDCLAGVRRVALDAAGGTVDTKALSAGVRQNVLGLTPTGGLAKVGSGQLTLAGTNVVWGLVDVREGTLNAHLTHRDLPAAPLFRFGMDSTTNTDLSGNGFTLTAVNPGTFSVTSRTASAAALAFNGLGYFTAPHNPHFTNVTAFTVSVWLFITNNISGSNSSILSTRPGGDRAFELKLTDGNLVRVLQHSDSTNVWWQEFRTVNAIPLKQWTHVAVTLTPQGIAMYLNGVRQSPIKQAYNSSGSTLRDYPGTGYYYSGDFRFVPAGRTGGFIIGRPSAGTSPGFSGAMDDLMLFERALTDAEVAALAGETAVRPAQVRAAWGATLDLAGEASYVSEASGSGLITDGTLWVRDRLAVGDSDAETPGALLSVADLTLGTNVVYACSGDGTINDLTAVSGTLTVNGAGTVDFGRTEAEPITSGFSATVMTYGAISGAANFADWKVTGLGRQGFASTVSAVDGRVVVSTKALWGTLMLLK